MLEQKQSDVTVATDDFCWRDLEVKLTLAEDQQTPLTDQTSIIRTVEHPRNLYKVSSNAEHSAPRISSPHLIQLVALVSQDSIDKQVKCDDQTKQQTLPRQGTVRFENSSRRCSSNRIKTEDTAPQRRSDGSLFQRLLSRSRSRTMTPRTKSRLATLLVLPDKGSSRRTRVTLDALPQAAAEENDMSGFFNNLTEKDNEVIRSDSVKSERRGRTLFRGIGSHFSTSARRSRARSPVRDREGILSRIKWRRMVSPSPDPTPRQRRAKHREAYLRMSPQKW